VDPEAGFAEITAMTIEMLYLTTQFQNWLDLQVARHLQAQAAKLKPASPEGIGMSGVGRPCDESDGFEAIDNAAGGAACSHEASAAPHSEKQTVDA
jgi:hypothetical protein